MRTSRTRTHHERVSSPYRALSTNHGCMLWHRFAIRALHGRSDGGRLGTWVCTHKHHVSVVSQFFECTRSMHVLRCVPSKISCFVARSAGIMSLNRPSQSMSSCKQLADIVAKRATGVETLSYTVSCALAHRMMVRFCMLLARNTFSVVLSSVGFHATMHSYAHRHLSIVLVISADTCARLPVSP